MSSRLIEADASSLLSAFQSNPADEFTATESILMVASAWSSACGGSAGVAGVEANEKKGCGDEPSERDDHEKAVVNEVDETASEAEADGVGALIENTTFLLGVGVESAPVTSAAFDVKPVADNSLGTGAGRVGA